MPALFLIVIVGLLGAVALRVSSAQQQTVIIALQQARALAAARAGIDWAAYRAVVAGNCASGALNLSEASLSGFTVTVTCTQTQFTDGANNYYSYAIVSTASIGTYGTADFVQRVVKATFTNDT